MKILFFWISLLLSSFVLSACSPVDSVRPFDAEQAENLLREHIQIYPANQHIYLSLPPQEKWQRLQNNEAHEVLLVPKMPHSPELHESLKAKAISYKMAPHLTAKKLILSETTQEKDICQIGNINMLHESSHSITYERHFTHCTNGKERWQIGKAFNGKDAVYWVSYQANETSHSATVWQKGTRIIYSAHLVPRIDLT